MRTNIVLDDDLVEQAFAPTGVRTKRQPVRLSPSEQVLQRQKKNLDCYIVQLVIERKALLPHENRDSETIAEIRPLAAQRVSSLIDPARPGQLP